MLEQLWDKLSGTDALVRALRWSDRTRFADVFARSTILFLQLPPGSEAGIDPNISQEQLLAHIRAGAEDLSKREQYTPLCHVRRDRKSLLLFTQQAYVKQFAHAYVRQFKRIMGFEVIGVKGEIAVRLLNCAESVVFNAYTKYEYELPMKDIDLLKERLLSKSGEET
jgi:hypothetical protein